MTKFADVSLSARFRAEIDERGRLDRRRTLQISLIHFVRHEYNPALSSSKMEISG
jgi:hypothetical protein